MKKILFLTSMLFFTNFSYSADLPDLNEKNSITLEKIKTLDQIRAMPTEEEFSAIEPDVLNLLTATFRCDLYGTYVIKHQGNKIGIISLGNATGTYYEDKAEYLGFTNGSWAEISIFLDPEHVGQGHYSRVNERIIELITPFIGHHHAMPSNDETLPLSPDRFKGIRGLIGSHNILSLHACLKNGRCLIDIEQLRGNWITQYPSKDEFTEIEIKIRQAADAIITETLESFRSEEIVAGNIPSSSDAIDSFSGHYSSIFKK